MFQQPRAPLVRENLHPKWVGLMYPNRVGITKNDEIAVNWLTLAAMQGLPRAQYQLGQIYRNSQDISIQSYENAFKWHKKAAQQRYTHAEVGLGKMYERGEGIEKDQKKALNLYTLAAKKGFSSDYNRLMGLKNTSKDPPLFWKILASFGLSDAKINIGTIYFTGDGVPQHYNKALNWYKQAAIDGNEDAQEILGGMHEYGLGVKKDFVYASMWYNLARIGGSSNAARKLENLTMQITKEQSNKARALALSCKKKDFKNC